MKHRSQAYSSNINKRGQVPTSLARPKEDTTTVGPVLLALFMFVVIGSAVFQILQTASSA
eukprot:CAMPEP_0204906234 /NCGR_PEP_ID=MMETSP1397-20131031/5874_1 /ASSEMBLY_ACC=CAM_ASM_000891 /TAXON_ID=49980 /ORGANISM="Climacostomum Climacostomum virens, Strain Stock W-24" /LENGTH=59 /DNA_ID=CAMNT_0052075221 /DNA_START=29 /DNA_END=208 /DNA_ORIENTATION=+